MEKRYWNLAKDPFLTCLLAFLCAVGIASLIEFSLEVTLLLIAFGLSFVVYAFRSVAEKESRRKVFVFCGILLCFSLGILRYQVRDLHIINEGLLEALGEEVSVELILTKEPVVKGDKRVYVGEALGYGREKIIVRADLYPEFSYGDRVLFTGRLEKPKSFNLSNGRVFNYGEFLSKDDIFLTLSFAQGEFVSQGSPNFIKKSLFSIKELFVRNLERVVSEPEAGLLSGILLGKEDSLGSYWEEKFRITGLSHIVVLSGYNITLVSESFLKIFSFLSGAAAIWGSILGITLFSVAVGGGASVIRAALMALIIIIARATGRTYFAGRALILVAFLMVFLNPKILIFDLGFQLSFLSAGALIWGVPLFKSYTARLRDFFNLKEIFIATLTTQLFVLPLLLYTTGSFSLTGIVVNILVLPVIPVIMFLGFITGVVGFFGSASSFLFGALSELLLRYVLIVVEFFSRIDFLNVSIRSFPWFFVFLSYGLFGYLFFKLKKERIG